MHAETDLPAPSRKLLAGKRAFVTGGTRGLGRMLCTVFAGHGASVAFTYARNEDAATELVSELEGMGGEPRASKISVLDLAGTEAWVRELERSWGEIDILVNNAGTTQNLPLALLTEEDFDHVMDVNAKGTYLTMRAVLRGMMRRRRGAVLNIGSLAGERMIDAPIHYCASKAAVHAITEAAAKEVAKYGIRINCLAPGVLEDGLGRQVPDHHLGDYLRHCALGRVGTFSEVAELAAFMVSDRNSYMSGATIVMDGGV